jgi:hypothetical protein
MDFLLMHLPVLLSAAINAALGVAILRGRTYGGLTFCRLGRLGFSFYISKRTN